MMALRVLLTLSLSSSSPSSAHSASAASLTGASEEVCALDSEQVGWLVGWL
jgi:hypothetical protein